MDSRGRTPLTGPKVGFAREVVALLDGLGVAGAALLGGSMGGRTAIEVAIARPELVAALVLVGPGLPVTTGGRRSSTSLVLPFLQEAIGE